MNQPIPVQPPGQAPSANKRTGAWAAAIVGAIVIIGAMVLNGRAIEQYLFGYGDIYRFLLYQTKWPVEAVQGFALLIWGSYTVVFTVLSYSAIGRVFVGRPTRRVATIGLLALVVQAPLLFLEAALHKSPTPITDLRDLQCFDTRTKGRVIVWYYKDRDGAITLFENGYGGSWRGQELQPATQDICDQAQAGWKASENEALSKEAERKAAALALDKKLAALESTHNFTESSRVRMQWKAFVFLFSSEEFDLGIRLVTMRTIHQPETKKANAELALSVCNNGEWKIVDQDLHIWYVPDDQSRTVRWKYSLKDLPAPGCAPYTALTEIDDISSLSSIAGTLYFSDTSARQLISTHISNRPAEDVKKAPESASYVPPAAIPQRQIPKPVWMPYSDGCLSGSVFVPKLGRCIPAAVGSQDNCPDDHIYITSLSSCLPITIGHNYKLYAGNRFTVSAGQKKTIELIEGAALVTDAYTNQAHFINAGQRIEIYGAATFRASTFSRINVFYE